MKSIVLRNGLYATLFILIPSLIGFWWGQGKEMDYSSAEFWGYLTLLLAMVFVFLGMRQYRDREQEGYLSFGEGLKIGALIVVIPALAFGLYNVVYALWLDPGFMDNYFNHNLEQLQASLSAEEYAAKEQELLAQKDFFMNPLLNFVVMFFTVFILGFIVSIISSLVLMRPRPVVEEG